MIAIVNYGVGNLKSLQNAFRFLGVESKLITTPEEVLASEKLILPGVGAFGFAMQNIEKLALKDALIEKTQSGAPILGICLGMQLFFTRSFEGGEQTGLDLIPGQVKRIECDLKVPHIGWNQVLSKPSSLFKEISSGGYGYFVHSYYCEPENSNSVVATTDYGVSFASAVAKDNVFGVQFHPEKSQELGLKILQNFAEL